MTEPGPEGVDPGDEKFSGSTAKRELDRTPDDATSPRETMQVDGREYEIVPPVPDSDFTKFTPMQNERVATLYRIIANALPLEGRDYGLKISFPDERSTDLSVRFEPKTSLGKYWCNYVAGILRSALTTEKQQ